MAPMSSAFAPALLYIPQSPHMVIIRPEETVQHVEQTALETRQPQILTVEQTTNSMKLELYRCHRVFICVLFGNWLRHKIVGGHEDVFVERSLQSITTDW